MILQRPCSGSAIFINCSPWSSNIITRSTSPILACNILKPICWSTPAASTRFLFSSVYSLAIYKYKIKRMSPHNVLTATICLCQFRFHKTNKSKLFPLLFIYGFVVIKWSPFSVFCHPCCAKYRLILAPNNCIDVHCTIILQFMNCKKNLEFS